MFGVILEGPSSGLPAAKGRPTSSPDRERQMIAALAKFIDWSVLQVAYAIALRAAPESKWKLEEASNF